MFSPSPDIDPYEEIFPHSFCMWTACLLAADHELQEIFLATTSGSMSSSTTAMSSAYLVHRLVLLFSIAEASSSDRPSDSMSASFFVLLLNARLRKRGDLQCCMTCCKISPSVFVIS
ncbi:hypothetical protein DPMN_118615 [Dreissena polymorpha]|uniref:Uncharacterized protein n=1 Tax=Dreissena polymorpha TaxID=45954 RepID=A0A9D4JLW3_DREPO|nr:hypothetical protein DPMN_118615 [Dreissena polymorpha]